jgi:hypothetical protein
VQKYIKNQHNIGNKVEDMITFLETFLGESVKVFMGTMDRSFSQLL